MPSASNLRPLCAAILLLSKASSFSQQQQSRQSTRTTSVAYKKGRSIIPPRSFSSAPFLNNSLVSDEEATAASVSVSSPSPFVWNNTLATRRIQELEELTGAAATAESKTAVAEPKTARNADRVRLKRELARAAIIDFHPDALSTISSSGSSSVRREEQLAGRTAEDIMKELEGMKPLPIPRPAMHRSLNAEWSFVFTGVPTIGMRLITLLSRISQSFPFEIVDFRDVALCVTNNLSEAKAVVEVKVCGAWELMLEVCTSLRRPDEEDLRGEYEEFRGEEGTLLLEHFQGVHLNGIQVPTPKHWHTTRTLEITYMDKDIMIARTSGGEPHLLLRNSPLCYSAKEMMLHNDDNGEDAMEEEMEECGLDGGNKWTEFFSEAIEIYGERITRCLVDRDFGREEHKKKEMGSGKDDERWWTYLADGVNLGRQWGVGED